MAWQLRIWISIVGLLHTRGTYLVVQLPAFTSPSSSSSSTTVIPRCFLQVSPFTQLTAQSISCSISDISGFGPTSAVPLRPIVACQ